MKIKYWIFTYQENICDSEYWNSCKMIFTFGNCFIYFSLISQVFIINNKLIKNHYGIIFLNEGKNRKLKIEVSTNVDELLAT